MGKPSGSKKKRVYDKETIGKKSLQSLKRLYEAETARQRILQLLFFDPMQEFALSEIARQGGVSKSTASKIIFQLQKEGIANIIRLPVVLRIRANYETPAFRREKMLYNLAIMYRSGLIEYLEKVFKHPKNIVLFGSFSKGEDTASSDIDIAIEDDSAKQTKILRINELNKVEKQLGREIVVHVFNRKYVDLNLFNGIANGIVLSGFLEVKK